MTALLLVLALLGADGGSVKAIRFLNNTIQQTAWIDSHGRCFGVLPDGGTQEDKSAFCAAIVQAQPWARSWECEHYRRGLESCLGALEWMARDGGR